MCPYVYLRKKIIKVIAYWRSINGWPSVWKMFETCIQRTMLKWIALFIGLIPKSPFVRFFVNKKKRYDCFRKSIHGICSTHPYLTDVSAAKCEICYVVQSGFLHQTSEYNLARTIAASVYTLYQQCRFLSVVFCFVFHTLWFSVCNPRKAFICDVLIHCKISHDDLVYISVKSA